MRVIRETMKRRWISAALALCCAIAGGRFETERAWAESAQAVAGQKPNIIVILADDLGYADISAYGIHRIDTPNIDSIGNEGIKFTDGYASAPVCAPSRAGLQTGRYQDRFGFEFNNGPARRDMEEGLGLAVGEITLADELRKMSTTPAQSGSGIWGTKINSIRLTAVTTSSLGSCRARLLTSIRVCRAFIFGTRGARPTRMRPASGLNDIREGPFHRLSRDRTERWCITSSST